MGIGEYFMLVITSSVIGALMGLVCPEGGIKRSFELCISLFLLCVAIAPIGGLISEARERLGSNNIELRPTELESSVDKALYASLAEMSAAEIEEILHARLCKELDIVDSELDVDAFVTASRDGVSIERIVLRLYGGSMWLDRRALESALAAHTDAEAIIVYGG